MKINVIHGSGIGTHPCADSGWKITPETHREEEVLERIVSEYKEDFPLAIQGKWVGGSGVFCQPPTPRRLVYVFLPRCCTNNNGSVPQCGGSPKGARQVAQAILTALAE